MLKGYGPMLKCSFKKINESLSIYRCTKYPVFDVS